VPTSDRDSRPPQGHLLRPRHHGLGQCVVLGVAVKTELIRRRGPWRVVEHVEAATLDYVYRFNTQRLFEANGDMPPVELKAAYYRHNRPLAEAG
jgi:transposase InsO family protein